MVLPGPAYLIGSLTRLKAAACRGVGGSDRLFRTSQSRKTTYTTVIMTTLACPKRQRSLSGSKIDPSSAHATVGTFRATTRQRAAKLRSRDALAPRDGCDARHISCMRASLCVRARKDQRTAAKLHRVRTCEANKHPFALYISCTGPSSTAPLL